MLREYFVLVGSSGLKNLRKGYCMARNPKPEKAFDTTRDPTWAEKVDKWPWIRRDEDEVAKMDRCPRCKHTITVTDRVEVFAMMMTQPGHAEQAPGMPAGPRKYAACNCGVKHPDTPDGKSGCGANGLIARA